MVQAVPEKASLMSLYCDVVANATETLLVHVVVFAQKALPLIVVVTTR